MVPALLLAGTLGAMPAAAQPEGWTRVDARWVVTNVSPSGRVLELRYESGGCYRNGRVAVTEAARRVTIRVTQEKPADPAAICPAFVSYPLLRARLKTPIAGRAIPGMADIRFIPDQRDERFLVPRVLGLRASDARRVLRSQSFEPRGARRGTVARQRPRARTRIPPATGTPVTLVTRR